MNSFETADPLRGLGPSEVTNYFLAHGVKIY
jgi:hypothetical protein